MTQKHPIERWSRYVLAIVWVLTIAYGLVTGGGFGAGYMLAYLAVFSGLYAILVKLIVWAVNRSKRVVS
jgi:uncharacterized protein (DUF58 family)